MSIEFQCGNCQNILKVSDEHAGKSARCPSCKTISVIPAQAPNSSPAIDTSVPRSAPPTPPPGNPFSDPQLETAGGGAASNNPYTTPVNQAGNRPMKIGAITPTAVAFEEIFEYSWNIWKANLGFLVAMTAIVAVVAVVGSLLPVFVILAVSAIGEPIIILPVFLMMIVFAILFSVLLQIGQIRVYLKMARQQPVEMSELFSATRLILPALLASILFSLGSMIGFMLLIIPGILFLLYFWLHLYFIADERAGVFDSFSMAGKIGGLNIGTSILIWLVAMALGLLGSLMLYVGLLFTTPLIGVMTTVAYLKMSGQLQTA